MQVLLVIAFLTLGFLWLRGLLYGLNFRDRRSWRFLFYGFTAGITIGFLSEDFISGVVLAIILVAISMVAGPIMHSYRKQQDDRRLD
jgi:hypothetical protein